MNSKKSKVFIVDDHPIFRKGLIQLINEEKDMEVCGEAEDAFSAAKKIKQLMPDVIIVDITLKDASGLELVKFLTESNINIPVLVLSMHDEKIFAERSLKAGARGYIMKQEMSEKVTMALRQIMAGKIYVSEAVNERILTSLINRGDKNGDVYISNPEDLLTDRELEIFRLMGKGFKRNDIAKFLNINVNTVGTYRERIKEKLNISSSNELMAMAVSWVRKIEKEDE